MPQNGFSEQELLADLMNQEKQLILSCAETLQEAAEPNLRRLLLTQFQQTSKDQYELLDQMRSKGYQPDGVVSRSELRQILAELKGMQGA